jgi:excisionase family DNA binding protein
VSIHPASPSPNENPSTTTTKATRSELKNSTETSPSAVTPAVPKAKAKSKGKRTSDPAASITPEFISFAEAAQLISVSPQLIAKKVRSGELRVYRFGRRLLLRRREVLACVEAGLVDYTLNPAGSDKL